MYCVKDCNFGCYLDRYADLRRAFGTDHKKAENHWFNHGRKEKRNCRCVGAGRQCDWRSYLKRYKYLHKAFSQREDPEGLAERYFIKFGKRKGHDCR